MQNHLNHNGGAHKGLLYTEKGLLQVEFDFHRCNSFLNKCWKSSFKLNIYCIPWSSCIGSTYIILLQTIVFSLYYIEIDHALTTSTVICLIIIIPAIFIHIDVVLFQNVSQKISYKWQYYCGLLFLLCCFSFLSCFRFGFFETLPIASVQINSVFLIHSYHLACTCIVVCLTPPLPWSIEFISSGGLCFWRMCCCVMGDKWP